MVSEPAPTPISVTYDYGAGFRFGGYVVRDGVIQIPPAATRACAVIKDIALAEALALGGSSELELSAADVGIIIEPAQAAFSLIESAETPSCEPDAGRYVQFLSNGINLRADGRIELRFAAPANWDFSVETSTDLLTWSGPLAFSRLTSQLAASCSLNNSLLFAREVLPAFTLILFAFYAVEPSRVCHGDWGRDAALRTLHANAAGIVT